MRRKRLAKANFSMFVEKEFERYLELAAENPSISLLMNRYRLIPEEEQNFSLSLGWGLILKLTERAGHEMKVLTEQYGYTIDRKLVKISETEKSFLDKTLQHLKKLASPESDQNAHFKTIFNNLYNIVYTGTSHYDFADVSRKASKSISIGQVY